MTITTYANEFITNATGDLLASPNAALNSTRSDARLGASAEIIKRLADRHANRNAESIPLKTSLQTIKSISDYRAGSDVSWTRPPTIKVTDWQRATTFSSVQEWEGYVVSVSDGHLIANLVNLTTGSVAATDQAQIPLEELNSEDLEKLSPGRIFRWAIGYQRSRSGTRMRVSNIVFRDLPQWTQREIDEAFAEANQLVEFFESTEPTEPTDEQ